EEGMSLQCVGRRPHSGCVPPATVRPLAEEPRRCLRPARSLVRSLPPIEHPHCCVSLPSCRAIRGRQATPRLRQGDAETTALLSERRGAEPARCEYAATPAA